jgi:hypothetical protein
VNGSDSLTKTFLIPAGGEIHTFSVVSKFVKVSLLADQGLAVNGNLQTMFHVNQQALHNRKISDPITNDTDCKITNAVMTTQDSITGDFGPLQSTNGDLNLTITDTTLGTADGTIIDSTPVKYTKAILTAKDQSGIYQNVRSNSVGNMIMEARLKPIYDGVGFKSANADGTVGIVVDGKRFRAQELVQRSSEIFIAGKSCVPLFQAGDYIKMFTSPEAPVLTSSSTADSLALDTGATKVLLQGWSIDVDGEWFISADIFELDGQNEVSGLGGVQFIGVIGSQVIQTASGIGLNTFGNGSIGNLYFTSLGEPKTLGVPNTLNDSVFAVGEAGSGVLYCSYVRTPPTCEVYYSEHVFSGITPSNNTISAEMNYYSRVAPVGGQPNVAGQQFAWLRVALLTLTSDNPSTSAHQGSFPNLSGSIGGDLPTDLTIIITKYSGNGTDLSHFSNLTGHFVSSADYGF